MITLVFLFLGNFLFAKLVLDLIERGHLVIKSSSFKVLPVSLAEVFQLECNLKFTTVQSFSKVTDILSVCLASLVPLSVLEIYNAVNALKKEPESNWQDFVSRFNMLSGMYKKMIFFSSICNSVQNIGPISALIFEGCIVTWGENIYKSQI